MFITRFDRQRIVSIRCFENADATVRRGCAAIAMIRVRNLSM